MTSKEDTTNLGRRNFGMTWQDTASVTNNTSVSVDSRCPPRKVHGTSQRR